MSDQNMDDFLDQMEPGGGLFEGPAAMRNVRFETDADYNDGETLLLVADLDPNDPETGIHTQLFTIGDGWEKKDKGKRIDKAKGRLKYHENSHMGMILAGANGKGVIKLYGEDNGGLFTNNDGFMEEAKRRYNDDNLGPFTAGMWEGLVFDWERVEIDYGGEIGVKTKLLPTAYLGTWEEWKKGGSKKATETTPEPAETEPADETPAAAEEPPAEKKTRRKKSDGDTASGMTAEIKAQIEKIADEVIGQSDESDEADDLHAAYVERAYKEVAGVEGDEAIQAAIDADGEGSIWSAVLDTYD